MIFNQAAAPTGWTKQTGTALANTAMSIVTGTGGGTGGSDSFYSTFASSRNTESKDLPVSGSVSGSVGNTTLSTPQIASHNHPRPGIQPTESLCAGNCNPNAPAQARSIRATSIPEHNISPQPVNLGNAGGGGNHNHPFSGNLSSANAPAAQFAIPSMNIKYANVIVANKD